jgi:hypothetical protein
MKKLASLIPLFLAACVVAAAQGARHRGAAEGSVASSGKVARPERGRLPKATFVAEKPEGVNSNDDVVEQLLERYMEAQGGVLAISKIKTRIVRGTVEISISNLPGTFESYQKAPHKALSVLNAPSGQFINAYDGSKKWLQSPWGGSIAVDEKYTELLKRHEAVGRAGFKWRSLFSSISFRGRALVEGHETVVLAATPSGLKPTLMYFDVSTSLLRKEELLAHDPSDANPLKAIYIDSYAEVDGVKIPSIFRQEYADYTLTFRIYEVKHNLPIEDSLFDSPKRVETPDNR